MLPNGQVVDTEAPYQLEWDSTQVLDGKHKVIAKAFDSGGLHLKTVSLPLHVVNQGGLGDTVVLEDFEGGFVDWRVSGGAHSLDGSQRVSPFRDDLTAYRGNRALRLEVGAFGEQVVVYHDDGARFGRFDLSRYQQLRFWAKAEGDGQAEISVALIDRDHEVWNSNERFSLTDVYQGIQLELSQDKFHMQADDNVENGDRQIDLISAHVRFRFHNVRPEGAEHMIFYVDDLLGDRRARVSPTSPADVLFDFENSDENWQAFGHYVPSVDSSFQGPGDNAGRILRYENNNMPSFGGVTYRFENPIDISDKDEIGFDGHCVYREECYLSFGFQDADGEVWSSRGVFVDSRDRQVMIALDRASFSLVDLVAVDGVSRNYRPDFDGVRAITFVARHTRNGGSIRFGIDNVFVRQK